MTNRKKNKMKSFNYGKFIPVCFFFLILHFHRNTSTTF